MLNHLVRAASFEPSVSPATIAATTRAYRTGWLAYAAATLLTLAFPIGIFAAYIAIAGYYLIPRGVDSDQA
jgi:hypothetical protein